MSINLPPGVSLHPNSSTRNRVQPTGDFIPFSVRAAVGQTQDLFVAYASDGVTKRVQILAGGQISCPDTGSFSERFGASSQAPNTDCTAVGFDSRATASDATAMGAGSRATAAGAVAMGVGAQATGVVGVAIGSNALAGGTDSVALGFRASATGDDSTAIGTSATTPWSGSLALGAQATTTAIKQAVIGSGFSPITAVYLGNGVTNAVPVGLTLNATGGGGANVAGASLTLAGGQGTGSAVGGDIIFQSSLADGAGSSLNALHELMRLSNVGVLSMTQLTSIQDRTAFDVTPSWATATDASRKARTVFNVYDTVAREAFRIESNGSAAMLGFLGAAAVAQQPSTADLKDAWCGFGFQVNGGATPLNLDGGAMTAANYATAIATKTANYTLTATDGTIWADTTSAGFSVTLPTAVGIGGRTYTVKNIGTGSNGVTVLPTGSETIDNFTSVAINIPEMALDFRSDNTVWRIV